MNENGGGRILEKFSKKRGRPKGYRRERIEAIPHGIKPEGCLRTQVNWCFALAFIGPLFEAGAATQIAVLGCDEEDIKTGKRPFPKGFKQASEAAGRWIEAGNKASTAIGIMLDARERGISFSEIAAHFRRLRLGEKAGSKNALLMALARTLDDYRLRFPGTTPDQEREAIAHLLEIVSKE